MSGMSPAQKRIYSYFQQYNIVAYQPGLGLLFGSTAVGLMLSQLLYWQGKEANKSGWMYKTVNEMQDETGLTKYQQQTAIGKLTKSGILEVRRAGVPAKRHFRLDVQELENQLTRLAEQQELDRDVTQAQLEENQPTNTEITQKITSKNTPYNTPPKGGAANSRKIKGNKSKTHDVQSLADIFGDVFGDDKQQ